MEVELLRLFVVCFVVCVGSNDGGLCGGESIGNLWYFGWKDVLSVVRFCAEEDLLDTGLDAANLRLFLGDDDEEEAEEDGSEVAGEDDTFCPGCRRTCVKEGLEPREVLSSLFELLSPVVKLAFAEILARDDVVLVVGVDVGTSLTCCCCWWWLSLEPILLPFASWILMFTLLFVTRFDVLERTSLLSSNILICKALKLLVFLWFPPLLPLPVTLFTPLLLLVAIELRISSMPHFSFLTNLISLSLM